MKKLLLLSLTLFCFMQMACSQKKENEKPIESVVYKSGTDGYQSFRIPAIIGLPNNDLIAFVEGRVAGAADFGNVDIVMRKSSDDGKTWSEIRVVVENDSLQAGNPAPVVDLTDPEFPGGRIFLFYNTGDVGEQELRKGEGHRKVWYVTSSDKGKTWSEPTDITSQVKKPDWRSYANTPGHAMQFNRGKYKGRIYVAANHSKGDPQPQYKDYQAHGYYTDDHGKTFHLSENVSFPGSNEATAAELSDGKLMLNARNQTGDPKYRIVAISNDGGAHWDTTYYDHNLPDPVCEGSILNIGWKEGEAILAFCNNDSQSGRKDLTVRISFDGGATWARKFLVDEKGRSTAYSDIVKIDKYKVGVLYERDGYSQIAIKVIKWK